jgi:hypothetical protein
MPNSYTVTIQADSADPELELEAKMEVFLYPLIESTNTSLKNKMVFVRELLDQNPSCLEFKENIDRAVTLAEGGNLNEAHLLLDEIVSACKITIGETQAVTVVSSPTAAAATGQTDLTFGILMGLIGASIGLLILLKFLGASVRKH